MFLPFFYFRFMLNFLTFVFAKKSIYKQLHANHPMNTFLHVREAVPRIADSPFLQPLNWRVNTGEAWSILGRNGSGKSLFAEVVCGKYNLVRGKIDYPFLSEIRSPDTESAQIRKQIRIVSFQSACSSTEFRDMYYQQRFNSTETENSPKVKDLFDAVRQEALCALGLFDWEKLQNRRMIHLSSGELRKLLIAKTLLDDPRMIIFDNPFIGLDAEARKQLNETFFQLHRRNIQLVFLIASPGDRPSVTTHVLSMDEMNPAPPTDGANANDVDWKRFPSSLAPASVAVKMENIGIAYGRHVIASNIQWEVKRGEKWALLGRNGSGKSTLLSYIFADNPQAYSKELILFDRKRGTGESIWEIKKRIGFTSPEMHLYYRTDVPCRKVVESGFFDSIGLYRKCSGEQSQIAGYLFGVLNIRHLKERSFLKISSGEQRLILFARALVKNPELLILDEPFHGLDDDRKRRCLQIVESCCSQPDKSLIFVTHQEEEIPQSIHLRKCI